MSGQTVAIPTNGGGMMPAYLALPTAVPAPAVLVLQEIFGVNGFIRSVVDMMADQGFVAIAPELYWRTERGVELNSDEPDDMGRAMILLKTLEEAQSLEDCEAALAYLRAMPSHSGPTGAMGYCLGGKLAYLLAAHSRIDAAVSYYGTAIHTALEEADRLAVPIQLHIAGEDMLCRPEDQARLVDTFAQVRARTGLDVETHVYPGAEHGFTRKGRNCYHAEHAVLADRRTIDFFTRNLSFEARATGN